MIMVALDYIKLRAGTRRRLVLREYLPMAGSLLLWFAVAAACGTTLAALLLTAWVLVGAVRSLVAINLQAPVAFSLRGGGRIAPAGWRRVWLYEATTALLALGLIAVIAFFLGSIADPRMTRFLLIVAAGLPARHIGPLVAYVGSHGRETGIAATARGLSGGLLAGAAALAGADPLVFAGILAAREWFGLIALMLSLRAVGQRGIDSERPMQHGFEWRVIASASGRHGRKRITYRMLKMVLSSLLGPVGTALARTARTTKLIQKIEFKPAHAARIAAIIAMVAISVAGADLAHGVTPAHLVSASALFRLACIGANAWFWSWIGGPDILPVGDDDEDDD